MIINKSLENADFVLDCSVTMAWCFEDEVTEYTDNVFDSLMKNKAIVPSLWSLEVANVLLCAQRKKRINKIKILEFKDSLAQLPISIEYTNTHKAMSSIMELAEETNLSIYDATYLELALSNSLPLATLDKDLQKAAKKMDIYLYNPK